MKLTDADIEWMLDNLLDKFEEDEEYFSEWEIEFIETVNEVFKDGRSLSAKQEEKLLELWEKLDDEN